MNENATDAPIPEICMYDEDYGAPLSAKQERDIAADAQLLTAYVFEQIGQTEDERAALWAQFRSCADDQTLKDALRKAPPSVQLTYKQANRLFWRLAMSCPNTVRWELARLKVPPRLREDLSQLGHVGLLKAARRYDPTSGNRFSTLARWWVRAELKDALQRYGRLIRLPTSAAADRKHILRAREMLISSGKPASTEALSSLLNLTPRRIRLLSLQNHGCSIELEVNGTPLKELISSECSQQRALIEHQRCQQCAASFERLTTREQEILTRHLGLNGAPRETLAAIGRDLSLSRERIRQLEKLALQSMAGHID